MKFAKLVTVETRSLTHDYPTEEQRAFFWPYRPPAASDVCACGHRADEHPRAGRDAFIMTY